ncbi:LuxR C-terminal-related transcriptional regulator [Paenibacillus sacheonensis]|uniref:LuxR C-terminal-related transcriptional regulator n=1 Tax=Paenibacillus sacheonensis TaxID=742054 RepID=UPI0023BA6A79|nr:LuxR C-terminal-related transcriptional regulator [Paenibacillus sacheonensis]
MRLLGRGLNSRESADVLTITEGNVKNYVPNVNAKLELRDRLEVAIFAVKHGLAAFEA